MEQKLAEQKFVLPASGMRPGEHSWTPGSDVQSLWRRYGWTPPSETNIDIKKPTAAIQPQRRVLRG